MQRRRNRLPDRQCIAGVCKFCGAEARSYEGDEDPSANFSDGWIALMDMSPSLKGVYGEWCSLECFWNDFLAQAKAEQAKAGKKNV